MVQRLLARSALIVGTVVAVTTEALDVRNSETVWVPCPVLTQANATWNGTVARKKLGAGFDDGFVSGCTFASVPLDHDAPAGAGRRIELFVKRLTPRRPPPGGPTHAVWCLSGGPGDSSADDCEPLHALLAERLQPQGAFEVFIVDHRGVDRSERLGCRWSEAETPGSDEGVKIASSERPGCLASLAQDYPHDALHHFSSASGARDVHMLMERFRRPGQSINVYGISYGTYWAGRYARLFPGHARAIVMDGMVSMSGRIEPRERLTFERWDLKLQQVGITVLDTKCAGDQFCRSKLGPKPSEQAAGLFKALAEGTHCAGPLKALGGLDKLKGILGGLLYGWYGREVIPALLYRLNRCSGADEAVLMHLADSQNALKPLSSCCGVLPEDEMAPKRGSQVLQWNIALSELWDPSATDADAKRWADQGWFSMNPFSDWSSLRKSWPVYAPDATWNTTLNTSSPILMMNGDIDAQTPIWCAEYENATAASSAGVSLIVWPDAVHYSIMNTPVTDGGDPCGLTTVIAFLSDPGNEAAWRNPPCRSKLKRLDFRGDPALNKALWGTSDAYEGAPEVTEH